MDVIGGPLADVLCLLTDPIDDETALGDKVSLNVPLGVPLFDVFDASIDLQTEDPNRARLNGGL